MTQPNYKLWKKMIKEFGIANSEEEIDHFWKAYEKICAETVDPALSHKFSRPRRVNTHGI
jgi:hypothetical protein